MTGWVEQNPPPRVRLLWPCSAECDRSLCSRLDVVSGEVKVDHCASWPHGWHVTLYQLHHEDDAGHFEPGARFLRPQLSAT
jgi:hypothetical protein